MTEKTDIPDGDMDKALFVNLVMMLSTSSLQYLGAMPDPATGKADVNLEAAQAYIDMLDMLDKKTRGNLDSEEAGMLAESLSSLKLAYVQATSRAKKGEQPKPAAAPAAKPAGPAAEPAGTAPEPSAPPPSEPVVSTEKDTETKRPKFHKSYE
jgi:hypothetical protein